MEFFKKMLVVAFIINFSLPHPFFHRDVALTIVQSENWELALKNKILGEDGRATTPLRKLIQRLPGKLLGTLSNEDGDADDDGKEQ